MPYPRQPPTSVGCLSPYSALPSPNPLPSSTPLPLQPYGGKGSVANIEIGGGGPLAGNGNYYPVNPNYPVQRADQRLPYVNYLPVLKVNKVTSLRGPLITVYSPQTGRPDSAVYECAYQAKDRRRTGEYIGTPWLRREESCVNPLNWTERKGRKAEDFF